MTRSLGLMFVCVSLVACGGVDNLGGNMDAGNTVQAKFSSLYGDYLGSCSSCHSPNGPGRTSTIEKTLDFSTVTTAYNTLKTGTASGLTGNQSACNGAAFIGATPEKSLVVAVLDSSVRSTFDDPAKPDCDSDAISDMTLKVGASPSAQFLAALKTWITNGAPND